MPTKRGRPVGVTASEDTLAVVWILKTIKWSDRRVALFFSHHHSTISKWYERACELMEDNKLAIQGKGGGKVKAKPSGNSNDIEYLYGRIHQNPCGGGKRAKSHIYGNDWEDKAEIYKS